MLLHYSVSLMHTAWQHSLAGTVHTNLNLKRMGIHRCDKALYVEGMCAGGWENAHAAAARTQGVEAAFSDDEFEPLTLHFSNAEAATSSRAAASSPSGPKVPPLVAS